MSKHMDGSPKATDVSSPETLADKLRRIEGLEAEALKLFHRGLDAPPGRDIYVSDLFLVGAARRALAHCSGFRAMIGARNFPCAAPILRMQLDTGLRIFAGTLVANADDLASAVFRGTRVSTMRDRSGQKMLDAYLVRKLMHEVPWGGRPMIAPRFMRAAADN